MDKIVHKLRTSIGVTRGYDVIHARILLYIAWRNFTSKKLRSFLTVFGVVIGVSAIYFLLSFGLGIQQLVTTQVVGDKSLKAIDVDSPNSKLIKLDENLINKFKSYPHVEAVGVQYSFPGIVTLSGGEIDSVVTGLDKTYQGLSSFKLLGGRLLDPKDGYAVVVSSAALQAVGVKNPKDALNKDIQVNIPLDKSGAKQKSINNKFTIVGVIDAGSNSEVYMPSALFDIAGVPTYDQSKVVIDDMANVTSVRRQIESNGLQTSSLVDTLSEINNVFRFFNLLLLGFGSIGMIVAVLGMFNTLTISLIERTREIGLMMALGARRRDMRRLFIFEAVLISLVGAVIGLSIAIIAGKVINVLININSQSRGVTEWFEIFATPWWSILAVLAGTVLVGLAVVYFPAKRAEHTDPIDALRRE